MAGDRSETFLEALGELRGRLNQGVYPPGTRLAAAELAAEFELSPTPMREVLARLAGEGLLEDRRGQGFFLRRFSSVDVADLYRLSLAHLRIALERPSVQLAEATIPPSPMAQVEVDGEVGAIWMVDQLFQRWVASAGGRLLARSYGRIQTQLAQIRRIEPQFLPDLTLEAVALAGAADATPKNCLPNVRVFFRRRIRIAAKLADSLSGDVTGP